MATLLWYCDECGAKWHGNELDHICPRSPVQRIKQLEEQVDTLQKAVIQLQREQVRRDR